MSTHPHSTTTNTNTTTTSITTTQHAPLAHNPSPSSRPVASPVSPFRDLLAQQHPRTPLCIYSLHASTPYNTNNNINPNNPNNPLAPPYHQPPAMADAPRQDARPARLPNGYVDLTSAPDSPPLRRKRQSPTPGPSKRHKHDHGDSTAKTSTPDTIEQIDLSNDQPSMHDTLQKQRQDAIRLQQKPKDSPTTFNTITCVICMDTPTDLTATACGHLFCHTCLMEALIAGENRSGPGEPKRSQCPVCRKFINRSKAADVIPLLLKKGLATQPRKKATTTTAKA